MFKGVLPFEFYPGYLPLIILLFIFIFKYKFPGETLYIILPLLITGILNVYLENDTYGNLFKILINIAVNVIFYRYVIHYYDYDIKRIFSVYLKFAYIVAILGMFQWASFLISFTPGYNWKAFLPLNKWMLSPGGIGLRINSTLSEPSYYGTTMAPAFFISFYELVFNRDKFQSKQRSLIIAISYVLSFSSLAFFGVFLSVLLIAANFGLVRYVLVAIPVIIGLYFAAYYQSKEFRSRMDGMKALFIDNIIENELMGDFKHKATRTFRVRKVLPRIHGSSFVLYNNYHVAVENFKQNPLFGSGLGSHEIAFSKYKLNYLLAGIYEFNSADANSMFLRTLSEMGLMGVIFTFFFIFKFYVSKNLAGNEDDDYWLISNALLIVIAIQLLRQGNYTYGGFFLFGWMYYYNRIRYNEMVSGKSKEVGQVEADDNKQSEGLKPQTS